mmetsp:Transcript_10654/g.15844  ORF Transcript_10654/g.15844 Transcript_10654/m.15844 type:complete len:110 (+) Transcript_10654:942-1271(+)
MGQKQFLLAPSRRTLKILVLRRKPLPCTRKFNELHFEVPQPGNTCDFSSRLLWEVLRASRLWREAPKAPPSLVEDSVHDSAGDGFVDCFWSPVEGGGSGNLGAWLFGAV